MVILYHGYIYSCIVVTQTQKSVLTGPVQVSHFLKAKLHENTGNLFDSPTQARKGLFRAEI